MERDSYSYFPACGVSMGRRKKEVAPTPDPVAVLGELVTLHQCIADAALCWDAECGSGDLVAYGIESEEVFDARCEVAFEVLNLALARWREVCERWKRLDPLSRDAATSECTRVYAAAVIRSIARDESSMSRTTLDAMEAEARAEFARQWELREPSPTLDPLTDTPRIMSMVNVIDLLSARVDVLAKALRELQASPSIGSAELRAACEAALKAAESAR